MTMSNSGYDEAGIDIPRDRLVNRIRKGFHNRLTLVTGSAGTGKTRLVMQAVRHTDRDVIWLNLDEADACIEQLVRRMIQVRSRPVPVAANEILRYLSYRNQGQQHIRNLAHLFVDYLAQTPESMVVLDDFHMIAGNRETLAFIEILVEFLPVGRHLVIVSRETIEFEGLGRWRIRQWVSEIRESELLLDSVEMDVLLGNLGLSHLPQSVKNRIAGISNRWIGLTVLACRIAGCSDSVTESLDQIEAWHTMDRMKTYLAEEVLLQLPERERMFICRTCCFDRLIPDEVDAYFDRSDSAEILENLNDSYSFIKRLHDRESACEQESVCGRESDHDRGFYFSYHELIATSAQNLLHRELGGSAVADAYLGVGYFLIQRGDLLRGCRLLIRAGKDAIAAGYAVKAFQSWDDGLPLKNLGSVFSASPDTVLRSFPDVALGVAYYLITQHQLDRAESILKEIIPVFTVRDDEVCVIRAYRMLLTIQHMKLDFESIQAVSKDVLEYAGDTLNALTLEVRLDYLSTFSDSGSKEKIRELIERGMGLEEIRRNPLSMAIVKERLAVAYYMNLGQFDQSLKLMNEVSTIYEQYHHVTRLHGSYFTIGMLHSLRMDDERAMVFLRKADELSTRYDRIDLRVRAVGLMGVTAARSGDDAVADQCEAVLRELLRNTQIPGPSTNAKVQLLLIDLQRAMYRKEVDRALTFAETYLDIAKSVGFDRGIAMALTVKSEIYSEAHRWKEAAECLSVVIDTYQRYGDSFWEAFARLVAATRMLFDPSSRDTDSFKRALKLCEENGLGYLLVRHEPFKGLISWGLTHGVCPEYLRAVYTENQSMLADIADDVRCFVALEEAGENALTIECMGGFQVRVGSERMIIWRADVVCRLFMLLLVEYPRAVHQEVIIEALWPHDTLEAGLRKLYSTVSYLRKTLEPDLGRYGKSMYIHRSERCYQLRLPPGSTVDFHRIEDLLESSRVFLMKKQWDSAYTEYLNALALEKGRMLPGMKPDARIESVQNRLELHLVEVGLRIVNSLFAQEGDGPQRAMRVLKRLKRRDPLNEDVIRAMMKALTQEDKINDALALYRSYAIALKKKNQAAPGEHMATFYHSLLRLARWS
ncbi:AAA family ATPase [bacterium]|nr:AAA family ATPase [candidate division CSSED10-310 bacterium]